MIYLREGEGTGLSLFRDGHKALDDLMEREGSPYVTGVLSADRSTITVTDTEERVATFRLFQVPEILEPDTEALNMNSIVEALMASGIPAYIEQTGGGVATLFAGKEMNGRYPAVAGSGYFLTPEFYASDAYADREDFVVSADNDGEGPYLHCPTVALAVAAIRALVESAS